MFTQNPLSLKKETDTVLGTLPIKAKEWIESLPWEKRRYVLSLCHLMCATPPEMQAEFLDEYTADGLISRIIQDRDTQQRVNSHLQQLHIKTELSEPVIRRYIRQFYIHSAQDMRQQPGLYLESALKLVASTEERNSVFCYILGFELIKLMFRMSWSQQERLYRLQVSQEDFIRQYIRPIQYAHRINGLIVPKDEEFFFARRAYFVQIPKISGKRLIELGMATFSTDVVTGFGFSIIRHANSFQFDYAYIYESEPTEAILE
ncbi:MAG: cobyrinic acid a,c-diamide synthase [Leptolyngbyaceae cyanobacterium SM1_1_3]|nr:cobyrinic acid a,c-diamide synthase [Leptolyngbyaceae cyanobacterium SM1_1_3]NJM85750.1 cobyrinic acid a,c-diamide synthase [Leptolyngbyaceae cyanobacterium RM2_2_21]NJN02433.1 cobyrinic acid a,c-diamide synthase [Leptolyngbyaceae cyanobacterium RM1_1_2]NJO10475.1 cobyrinic acid a,c-diamide synthase [Leptolyngbyaceae cyanobacterium SL_1_1]